MKKKLVLMLVATTLMTATFTGCGEKTQEITNSSVSEEFPNKQEEKQETSSEEKQETSSEEEQVVTSSEESGEIVPSEEQKENPENQTSNTENVKKDLEPLSIREVTEGANTGLTQSALMIDQLYEIEQKNTCFSSVSLDTAMGMLMQGADGKTREAMEAYYKLESEYKGERDTQLLRAYNSYDHAEVLMANGIFNDLQTPLLEDYVHLMEEEMYFANAKSLDFKNDSERSAEVINGFCNENTKGLIKKIISPEDLRDKDCILINALYFNGTWADPFKETNFMDLDFNNADGSVTTIDGMQQWGLGVYENENAIAFNKYYEGYDFSFYGILPKENICSENGDFKVADIDLDNLLSSHKRGKEAHILLPKFRVEDNNSLRKPLETQGLDNLFVQGKESDFSNMSERDMYVSDVLQKIVVDVTAEGTEAAAVTSIEMNVESCAEDPVEVVDIYLDRPFVFVIYDNVNHEVLFAGKITEMK